MDKKLSVITICYNIKDEIERTCESIVNQTNQNFEWVVIDGGSTDGTVDILNKYKKRIDVFVSEPDKGVYNAMNKGIKRASGEFLNFMNGGDCFADNTVVDEFLKHNTDGIDVLYGNMNYIKEDGSIHLHTYPSTLDNLYFCFNCISHQSAFIRRSLFGKYGLYNEQQRVVSDWEKWIIFIRNRCVFSYWNRLVSQFYKGGISSGTQLYKTELTALINKYYTKKERHLADKQLYRWFYVYLFGAIPLLCIKVKKDDTRLMLLLFNIIPLYKITIKNGCTRHYLFGFIPFLKIKEK